jgi:hypothetical protein
MKAKKTKKTAKALKAAKKLEAQKPLSKYQTYNLSNVQISNIPTSGHS